tara:strand:- start:739 stop:1146 length:408 start_codon:yes stop_codon:yes gene_type:complete
MHMSVSNIKKLSIEELRGRWAKAWGYAPHARLGRVMMEVSLLHKLSCDRLTPEQRERLDKLVVEYKRNPACFDKRAGALKPGTRLVRVYNGKRHSVLVKAEGFEYEGKAYSSLSKIANDITGSRWNGWLFFGLKR